jgi:hypothetical protein
MNLEEWKKKLTSNDEIAKGTPIYFERNHSTSLLAKPK